MGIERNIDEIRKRISNVCEEKGMDESKVTLVAVSKTIGEDRINEAVSHGIDVLGENKVQEILNKHEKIQGDVKWHMIGHLQRNKVKYIIDKVSMIHSIDSLRLAEEVDKRAGQANIQMDCLIQINIGSEDSKYGIAFEETETFLESLQGFENIRIMGLMAIAPYFEDNEEVRPYFKKMNDLFERLKQDGYEDNMVYLSMGMTHDYLTALEEGANIVRIGTGIFGKRNYNRREEDK